MLRFFSAIIVTYAYICVSINSSMAHATPSLSMECSPTEYFYSRSFGTRLKSRVLSAPSRLTSELLRTL